MRRVPSYRPRSVFFAVVLIGILSLLPIQAQTDNEVFWAETGGLVPIPDGFSVIVTENNELFMSNIPDASELPDSFARGEVGIEFSFIGLGTLIALDADIETAATAYANRVLSDSPAPTISTLTIGDLQAASLQTTITDGGDMIGAYLIMIEAERPGDVYPFMGIAHHPDDDVSDLIDLLPILAEEAFFPKDDVVIPGEAIEYNGYGYTIPDGFSLLYPPQAQIAITNIPEDRWNLPIDSTYDFQSGDIYIDVQLLAPEAPDDSALDMIRAYSGRDSSISWRVGEQNLSGIRYAFPNARREVHALQRPEWTQDDMVVLDVYARDVSTAQLRTLLRQLVAGITVPEWTVDEAQPVGLGNIVLVLPQTWSAINDDDRLFFANTRFTPTDFEEANPGDILVTMVPDTFGYLGLTVATTDELIAGLVGDFGAEQIYTTRELEIDGVTITVADVSAIEDRSGARTFFGQVFLLPLDDTGRFTALQVGYENRIDYETSVLGLMHALIRQILAG